MRLTNSHIPFRRMAVGRVTCVQVVSGGVLVDRGRRAAAAEVGDNEWGAWGELSDCSRTCGGGVQHQQRTCQRIGYLIDKRFISFICLLLPSAHSAH